MPRGIFLTRPGNGNRIKTGVTNTLVSGSHYMAGGKYCRRCEYYFITERMFCECCGMQLRVNPHCGQVYKEKVRAKKHELIENVLVRR
jgi:predicted amidophosphoribosyltransferase